MPNIEDLIYILFKGMMSFGVTDSDSNMYSLNKMMKYAIASLSQVEVHCTQNSCVTSGESKETRQQKKAPYAKINDYFHSLNFYVKIFQANRIEI